MDTSQGGQPQGKNAIEALTKEELIVKYKSLLGLAKKAKQAKDELVEENRLLKDTLSHNETRKMADANALLAMKEIIEEFTENKLQLATQLSELQRKSKTDDEALIQLRIENESLKRQLQRLDEDNDSLLKDIDRMEQQLKQVNVLGIEQKEHLDLLELEVNKLKEAEKLNYDLKDEVSNIRHENKTIKDQLNETTKSLSKIQEKYNAIKESSSEQRKKFNVLKERFLDVYRKLKQLKECKRILLETQNEYSEAVSKWQKEIIEASRRLCSQMNSLKTENQVLVQKLHEQQQPPNKSRAITDLVDIYLDRLKELQHLVDEVFKENQEQSILLVRTKNENTTMKEKLAMLGFGKDNLDIGVITGPQDETSIENKEESEFTANRTDCERTDEYRMINLKKEHNALLEELSRYKEISKESELLRDRLNSSQKENGSLLEELTKYKAISEEYYKLCDCLKMLQKENKYLLSCRDADKQEMHQKLAEIDVLMQENKELCDDIQETRNILKTLECEKVEIFNQAAFEKDTAEECCDILEDLGEQLQISKRTIEELELRFESKEREHAELLGEMRELNEALKARGDIISKQQAAQLELVAEVKRNKASFQEFDEDLNNKSKQIKEKDILVSQISDEIETARSKILNLQQVCATNEDRVKVLNEELQQMRHCDNQSEILSTTTEDAASRLREVDDSFEEKYNKLRAIAVKLKKKLQEQTAYIADIEEKHKSKYELKEEYDALRKSHELLKIEIEKYKKQIESQKHEMQKLTTSRKQTNVLNLEIEAAEKSLTEMTIKLANKTNQMEVLQERLLSKDQKITQLHKEIELLEAAKEAECIHSKDLKEQIDRLQAQIKDTLYSKQQALDASKDLERTRDRLNLELNDAQLQMANIVSGNEAALAASNEKTRQMQQKYSEVQTEYSVLQGRLKTTERLLEDLRVEFLDYKVKAQAVLRKNQNKDSAKEREQEEELLSLRATEKQLQLNVKMYETKLDENERQLNMLQEDNVSLQRRNRDLMDLVNELKQQNDNMAQEQRQQMQQQQEALKQQRLQIEQLDACHKEQLQQIESSFQRQLEALKTEHGQHQAEQRQPTVVGAAAISNSHQVAPNELQQSKIDFLLMEREDAEGSEEAAEALAHIAAHRKISTASSRRFHHDFMPLDELLASPMNAIRDTVTMITSTSLGRTDDDDGCNGLDHQNMQLQATKEMLQIQETRVRHLTALLAENEQDLAKLTQMNDMLKEELRRQERGVERQSHMHNSEYLKNIIIKFLTLNNGDEKTRLVPVLNAILKLSRSESEMLACVAKGQKATTDTNGRNWGNFLPSWGNNNN